MTIALSFIVTYPSDSFTAQQVSDLSSFEAWLSWHGRQTRKNINKHAMPLRGLQHLRAPERPTELNSLIVEYKGQIIRKPVACRVAHTAIQSTVLKKGVSQ